MLWWSTVYTLVNHLDSPPLSVTHILCMRRSTWLCHADEDILLSYWPIFCIFRLKHASHSHKQSRRAQEECMLKSSMMEREFRWSAVCIQSPISSPSSHGECWWNVFWWYFHLLCVFIISLSSIRVAISLSSSVATWSLSPLTRYSYSNIVLTGFWLASSTVQCT